MRLNHRIQKLEKVNVAQPQNCLTCGFPQRGRHALILSENNDPLPTCAACLRPLDENGIPLFTPFTHIILE